MGQPPLQSAPAPARRTHHEQGVWGGQVGPGRQGHKQGAGRRGIDGGGLGPRGRDEACVVAAASGQHDVEAAIEEGGPHLMQLLAEVGQHLEQKGEKMEQVEGGGNWGG